jgi:ABC-type iron transport system FetAB ATPase subunit
LYKEVDVLILNKATSALDEQTKAAVMEAIHRLNPDLRLLWWLTE